MGVNPLKYFDRLYTAPTAEILTANDFKENSRITSYGIADDLSWASTIAPGSYAAGSAAGTGVDVSGTIPLVVIDSRANGATGTVIVKIQDSNDNATFADWHTFDTITENNDNTFYEKEYTGTKQYIRAYYTVANAACNFGVSIAKKTPYSSEDTWITSMLQVIRQYAEDYQCRAYYTQTREMVLDSWPDKDYIDLPMPPLQSVTSVKYYDEDGTEYTFSTTYYDVTNTNVKSKGRITLKYGESWPTEVLRPSEPIIIRYVCGYTSKANFLKELALSYHWMLTALEMIYNNRALSVADLPKKALDFDKVEWF